MSAFCASKAAIANWMTTFGIEQKCFGVDVRGCRVAYAGCRCTSTCCLTAPATLTVRCRVQVSIVEPMPFKTEATKAVPTKLRTFFDELPPFLKDKYGDEYSQLW